MPYISARLRRIHKPGITVSGLFVRDLERAWDRFQDAGMVAEAEAVGDLLDRFIGYCGPHARLGDSVSGAVSGDHPKEAAS